MKNFIIANLFLFIFLLLNSCSINQANNDIPDGACQIYAPIDKPESTSLPRMTDLFESIDTVYLSATEDNSLISSVDDVKLLNDTIFIQSGETIFLFNRDGSYISRINRRGRGRGEYLSITRFDISANNKELYILNSELKKVVCYSFDGSFIRQFEIEDFVEDFAITSDGDFLFFNPKYYKGRGRRGVWKTDSNGTFKKQLITIDDTFQHIIIVDHYFCHINDKTIGIMGLEDHDYFYAIDNDSAKVMFQMTSDIQMTKRTKRNQEAKDNQAEYLKVDYFENDRVLQFVLANLQDRSHVRVLYDKEKAITYRTYHSDYLKITDVSEIFPVNVSCYNGYYIFYLQGNQIESNVIYHKLFPTVTEQSNPVLFIAK